MHFMCKHTDIIPDITFYAASRFSDLFAIDAQHICGWQASAVMFLITATDNIMQAADDLEEAIIKAIENDPSGGTPLDIPVPVTTLRVGIVCMVHLPHGLIGCRLFNML